MLLTRRKTRRRGFTLVEMLVAAALCMMIMVILTGAFSSGIEAFRQLKATGDMASKLRQATALLRRDLAAQHFDGSYQPGLSGPYLSDQRLDRVGWVPPEMGYVRFYAPRVHREGRDADGVPSTRMMTPYDAPAVNAAAAATHVGRFPAMSMTVKLPGNSLAEVVQANMPYAGGQTPPGQLAAVSLYEFGGNTTFVSKWSEVSYYLVARGDTTTGGYPLFTLYRKQTAMHPDGASAVKTVAGGNYQAAGTGVANPVNNTDLSQVYPVRTANAPAAPASDSTRYQELDPNRFSRFASPAEATIPNYKIPNAVGARNIGAVRPDPLIATVANNGANRPNLHRLPLPTDRNTPVAVGTLDSAQDQPVLHEVVSMELRFFWESLSVTDPNGNVRQMHAVGGDTNGLMQSSVGYANPLLAGAAGVDPLSRARADNSNISDVDDANSTAPFRELPRYTYAPLRTQAGFSYGYRPGGLNTSFLSAFVRQDTGANQNQNNVAVGGPIDINYGIYRPDGLQFKDTFDTWTRRSLPLQFPNLQYVNWDDASIAPPVPQGNYRSGNPYEDMKFITDPAQANNVPTSSLVPWEDRPPLRIRIRAVQIKLRVWDAKTQQTRQVTIVQDV